MDVHTSHLATWRRALAVMVAAAIVGGLTAGPASAKLDRPQWAGVDGPTTIGLTMKAVAALSRTDAWAVGTRYPGGHPNATPKAAVARWNGSTWSAASAPSAQELTSISARSDRDVWAGGFSDALFGPTRVWHYDGRAWSRVSSRGLPRDMTGKIVVNADHVWLVGEVDPGHRIQGAVVATYRPSAHRWSVDDLSPVGGFIDGVAVGNKRAWAVGSTSKYADLGHPMIASWNGRRWSVQTFGHVLGQLTNIAAHSAHDAMAVGFNGTQSTSGNFSRRERGIAITWNGKAWRPQHRKAMGHNPYLDNFTALAAAPHHEYWAAVTGRSRMYFANYLQFKGGRWRHTRGPHIATGISRTYFEATPLVQGMAHVPGTSTTLAVGYGALNYRQPPTSARPFWEQTNS